jgi:hypothetical protein
MGFAMQCSVHPPSLYILQHQSQLLPDWSLPVRSVLVVLQQCPVILLNHTIETAACKDRHRQQFLKLSHAIAARLRQLGHLAAAFDPRTGLPIDVAAGELHLDDVAVVRSLLGYPEIHSGDCAVILHPVWGGAVYPSVLLSSAGTQVTEAVIAIASITPLLQNHIAGSESSDDNGTNFLEYHHSRSEGGSFTE